jgi:hypothetical protein
MGLGGPAPPELWQGGLEVPASLGDSLEHGLVQVGRDVELAHLMGDRRAEDLADGRGVQGRAVGGNPPQAQAPGGQCLLEPLEEPGKVRIMTSIYRI